MTTNSELADIGYAMLDVADLVENYGRAVMGDPPKGVAERVAEAVRAAGGSKATRRIYAEFAQSLVSGSRAVQESTGSAANLLAAGQPQLRQFERQFTLRSVCQVLPVTGMQVPFVRELSPIGADSGASGVAELGTAADIGADADFTNDMITPGWLPASAVCTQQLLDDAPAFTTWLNGHILDLLEVREEIAMISGNGETANAGITGFLHDSHLETSTADQGDLTDAISVGAVKVANNGAIPAAVLVNPGDYHTALKASPTYFTALADVTTVVPTLGMPAGTCVVGKFADGAVIVDRQQANVTVYPQHNDFRLKGQALIVGSERVGFEITQPYAFCAVTF